MSPKNFWYLLLFYIMFFATSVTVSSFIHPIKLATFSLFHPLLYTIDISYHLILVYLRSDFLDGFISSSAQFWSTFTSQIVRTSCQNNTLIRLISPLKRRCHLLPHYLHRPISLLQVGKLKEPTFKIVF